MNNIDEKCLEKAAEFLEIRNVQKNQYFIHEGEPTGFFAGVIKGKVSIRKTHIFDKNTNQIVIKPLYKIITIKRQNTGGRSSKRLSSNPNFMKNSEHSSEKNVNKNKVNKKDSFKKNIFMRKYTTINMNSIKKKSRTIKINYNSNSPERNLSKSNFRIIKEVFDPEKYIISEEELFRRGEGYCFGEWALIYREPRSASIYTLEDCVFFILDEIHFKNSFLKSLNNSEYSKKKFALQNFLPFDMMDERQLSIYKNIVPITCKRNQIIFNEGATSDSIYLIYLGSFTLEKKYGVKQFRVLNLERGSIVGLESIFEGEESKYKCSLKLSCGCEVGLIFQLKINKLRPYIINKMRVSFKTSYIVFLKSLTDLYNKNIFVLQKMNKEKFEDIIGEEGKSDLVDLINENDDNIEHNGELFPKNWNSVLNIEPEDKYLSLFKECLKQKSYKNHKKDGSLRIFSSRQKNIKSETPINKNNYININIFKYFKNNAKCDLDIINQKTVYSQWSKKSKNLYIKEGLSEYMHNERLKSAEINIKLTKIKLNNNIILKQDNDEEIINKDEQFMSNNKKEKKQIIINNYILRNKPLKIDKKLLFDNNIIKENTKDNSNHENKYKTIHFNPNLINSKKIFLQKNFGNKIGKQIKEQINLDKINNSKNKKIIFNENKNNKIVFRNKSLLQNNKNTDSFYNIFSNMNNQEAKKYDKIDNLNSIKQNQKKNIIQLFNLPFISERESRKIQFLDDNKSINKSKNFSFTQKKNSNSNNKQINLLPVNLKTKQFLTSLNKGYKSTQNKYYFNNTNNKSFNKKNKKNEFMSSNYSLRKKKGHNSLNVDEHKNIYQQLNGFSVSYFEKINSNNNINNNELINKERPFPSSLSIFKLSFDSGIYKIPLISSSVKIPKKRMIYKV